MSREIPWREILHSIVSELDAWIGWDVMTDDQEETLRAADWTVHEGIDVPGEFGESICLDCGIHPSACSCSLPFPPHWRAILPKSG